MKVNQRTKKQKQIFLKTVSLTVVLCFTATTIAWAAPENTASVSTSLTAEISRLALDEKLGRVDEVFIPSEFSGNSPFIIYLQDAHANLGAQENISKITRFLGKEFKPEAILAEGGSGESDLTELRAFGDQKIKEKATRFWLREAVLTGAEREAIIGPHEFRFFGVEDQTAYEEGGKHFLEAHSKSQSFLSALKPLLSNNQKIKKERYNQTLLHFEELVSKFDSKKDLIPLVSLIANEARNLHINRWKYAEIEKFIDLILIELEGGSAERLFEVQKSLDPSKLFEEIELLKEEVKEALFQNDEERAIDQEEQILKTLGALVALEAMPSDYDYFVKHREMIEKYVQTNLSSPRTRGSSEQSLDSRFRGNDSTLKSAELFYRSARTRDEKIFENIKNILATNQIKRAFLVTGGFHSPGITERLRREHIPFILITPQISDEDNFENYFVRISGKSVDLDEFKKEYPQTSSYSQALPNAGEIQNILRSFEWMRGRAEVRTGLTESIAQISLPISEIDAKFELLWVVAAGAALAMSLLFYIHYINRKAPKLGEWPVGYDRNPFLKAKGLFTPHRIEGILETATDQTERRLGHRQLAILALGGIFTHPTLRSRIFYGSGAEDLGLPHGASREQKAGAWIKRELPRILEALREAHQKEKDIFLKEILAETIQDIENTYSTRAEVRHAWPVRELILIKEEALKRDLHDIAERASELFQNLSITGQEASNLLDQAQIHVDKIAGAEAQEEVDKAWRNIETLSSLSTERMETALREIVEFVELNKHLLTRSQTPNKKLLLLTALTVIAMGVAGIFSALGILGKSSDIKEPKTPRIEKKQRESQESDKQIPIRKAPSEKGYTVDMIAARSEAPPMPVGHWDASSFPRSAERGEARKPNILHEKIRAVSILSALGLVMLLESGISTPQVIGMILIGGGVLMIGTAVYQLRKITKRKIAAAKLLAPAVQEALKYKFKQSRFSRVIPERLPISLVREVEKMNREELSFDVNLGTRDKKGAVELISERSSARVPLKSAEPRLFYVSIASISPIARAEAREAESVEIPLSFPLHVRPFVLLTHTFLIGPHSLAGGIYSLGEIEISYQIINSDGTRSAERPWGIWDISPHFSEIKTAQALQLNVRSDKLPASVLQQIAQHIQQAAAEYKEAVDGMPAQDYLNRWKGKTDLLVNKLRSEARNAEGREARTRTKDVDQFFKELNAVLAGLPQDLTPHRYQASHQFETEAEYKDKLAELKKQVTNPQEYEQQAFDAYQRNGFSVVNESLDKHFLFSINLDASEINFSGLLEWIQMWIEMKEKVHDARRHMTREQEKSVLGLDQIRAWRSLVAKYKTTDEKSARAEVREADEGKPEIIKVRTTLLDNLSKIVFPSEGIENTVSRIIVVQNGKGGYGLQIISGDAKSFGYRRNVLDQISKRIQNDYIFKIQKGGKAEGDTVLVGTKEDIKAWEMQTQKPQKRKSPNSKFPDDYAKVRPQFLTVEEVIDRYQISESTVHAWDKLIGYKTPKKKKAVKEKDALLDVRPGFVVGLDERGLPRSEARTRAEIERIVINQFNQYLELPLGRHVQLKTELKDLGLSPEDLRRILAPVQERVEKLVAIATEYYDLNPEKYFILTPRMVDGFVRRMNMTNIGNIVDGIEKSINNHRAEVRNSEDDAKQAILNLLPSDKVAQTNEAADFILREFGDQWEEALSLFGLKLTDPESQPLISRLLGQGLSILRAADFIHYHDFYDLGVHFQTFSQTFQNWVLAHAKSSRGVAAADLDLLWAFYASHRTDWKEGMAEIDIDRLETLKEESVHWANSEGLDLTAEIQTANEDLEPLMKHGLEAVRNFYQSRSQTYLVHDKNLPIGQPVLQSESAKGQFEFFITSSTSVQYRDNQVFTVWLKDPNLLQALSKSASDLPPTPDGRLLVGSVVFKVGPDQEGTQAARIRFVQSWLRLSDRHPQGLRSQIGSIEQITESAFRQYLSEIGIDRIYAPTGSELFSKAVFVIHPNTVNRLNRLFRENGYQLVFEQDELKWSRQRSEARQEQDEVAELLTKEFGVPLQKRPEGYYINQARLSETDWTMNHIRNIEAHPIQTDFHKIKTLELTHALEVFPKFSNRGWNNEGVYLGLVKGIDHPVVIKTMVIGDMDTENDVINAQIRSVLGTGPKFYGLVPAPEKQIAYAMQVVPGREPKNDEQFDKQDLQEITKRELEAGLVGRTYTRTPSGRPVAIDAGNAHIIPEVRNRFIQQSQEPRLKTQTNIVRGEARSTKQFSWKRVFNHLGVQAGFTAALIDIVTTTVGYFKSGGEVTYFNKPILRFDYLNDIQDFYNILIHAQSISVEQFTLHQHGWDVRILSASLLAGVFYLVYDIGRAGKIAQFFSTRWKQIVAGTIIGFLAPRFFEAAVFGFTADWQTIHGTNESMITQLPDLVGLIGIPIVLIIWAGGLVLSPRVTKRNVTVYVDESDSALREKYVQIIKSLGYRKVVGVEKDDISQIKPIGAYIILTDGNTDIAQLPNGKPRKIILNTHINHLIKIQQGEAVGDIEDTKLLLKELREDHWFQGVMQDIFRDKDVLVPDLFLKIRSEDNEKLGAAMEDALKQINSKNFPEINKEIKTGNPILGVRDIKMKNGRKQPADITAKSRASFPKKFLNRPVSHITFAEELGDFRHTRKELHDFLYRLGILTIGDLLNLFGRPADEIIAAIKGIDKKSTFDEVSEIYNIYAQLGFSADEHLSLFPHKEISEEVERSLSEFLYGEFKKLIDRAHGQEAQERDNLALEKNLALNIHTNRSEARTQSGRRWLKHHAPKLYGKALIHVSPGFKPSPEWLAAVKDPEMQKLIANAHQTGGLEPLVTEGILELSEMGMNGIGVSLLYGWGPYQKEDGSIERRQVNYQDLIDAGKLIDLGTVDVPVEGADRSVRVWAAPFVNRDGKSALTFFLDDPEITTIIYPDLRTRSRQMLLLGRGALAVISELQKQNSSLKENLSKNMTVTTLNLPFPKIEPAIVQMNEALTVFAHPETIQDRFTDDEKLSQLVYGFTTHTPVQAGLQTFPLDYAERIRLNPKWRDAIIRHNQLDLTTLAMVLADAINAVSAEHGQITETKNFLYPSFRGKIAGIVNGVYLPHWQLPVMARLVGEEFTESNAQKMAAVHAVAKKRFVKFLEKKTGQNLDLKKLFSVEARRKTNFKAANIFIEAMKNDHLREEFLKTEVVQVFSGKPHESDSWGLGVVRELKALAQDERFKGRIIYIDNFNAAEADLFFQGADIMNMWSILETEASATGYMKALLNGVLVLATKTGGPLEHVREGENGFFVQKYGTGPENDSAARPPTPEGIIEALARASSVYRQSLDEIGEGKWDVEWRRMMWNAIQTTPKVDVGRMLRAYIVQLWNPARKAKEQILKAGDFQTLFSATLREKDIHISHLPAQLRLILEHASPTELQKLFEPIAGLPREKALYEFGERQIPRVMALIAFLTPGLLDRMKDWDPHVFEGLARIREVLEEGQLGFLDPGSTNDVMAPVRFTKDRIVSAPISLPAYSGAPEASFYQGKIWRKFNGLEKVGLALDQSYEIIDHSIEIDEGDPSMSRVYSIRSGADLREEWRVGIPVIPKYIDGNGITQHGRQYQILEFKSVRSEVRQAADRPDETSVLAHHARAEVRQNPVRSKQWYANLASRVIWERKKGYEKLASWQPAVVHYGGARVPEDHPYYDQAVEAGEATALFGFAIRTGAGDIGLMKAPYQGHKMVKRRGIQRQGVRILLPFEQNETQLTDDMLRFEYFIIRKLMLQNQIYGAIAHPGGFGTLDEIFETWRRGRPLVLLGREFWSPLFGEKGVFTQVWNEAGIDEQLKVRIQPLITDDIEEALSYIKTSSQIIEPYMPTREYQKRSNVELKKGMAALSKMGSAIVFVGRPNPEKTPELIEVAVNTAEKLATEYGINVRLASTGPLFDAIYSRARSRHWDDRLQAVLYVPEKGILPKGALSLEKQDKAVFLQDESNHQFMMGIDAQAILFWPGGAGTMNKLFDDLTVIQTGKIRPIPVFGVGRKFYGPIKQTLANQLFQREDGLEFISRGDLGLLPVVDNEYEILEHLGLGKPARSEARTTPEPEDEAKKLSLINPIRNILIAEDHPGVRDAYQMMARHFFRDSKILFQYAEDGAEALALFKEGNIDLIITDRGMPKMRGEELIAKVRETSQVPIIVVSADELDRKLNQSGNLIQMDKSELMDVLHIIEALVSRAEVRLLTYETLMAKLKGPEKGELITAVIEEAKIAMRMNKDLASLRKLIEIFELADYSVEYFEAAFLSYHFPDEIKKVFQEREFPYLEVLSAMSKKDRVRWAIRKLNWALIYKTGFSLNAITAEVTRQFIAEQRNMATTVEEFETWHVGLSRNFAGQLLMAAELAALAGLSVYTLMNIQEYLSGKRTEEELFKSFSTHDRHVLPDKARDTIDVLKGVRKTYDRAEVRQEKPDDNSDKKSQKKAIEQKLREVNARLRHLEEYGNEETEGYKISVKEREHLTAKLEKINKSFIKGRRNKSVARRAEPRKQGRKSIPKDQIDEIEPINRKPQLKDQDSKDRPEARTTMEELIIDLDRNVPHQIPGTDVTLELKHKYLSSAKIEITAIGRHIIEGSQFGQYLGNNDQSLSRFPQDRYIADMDEGVDWIVGNSPVKPKNVILTVADARSPKVKLEVSIPKSLQQERAEARQQLERTWNNPVQETLFTTRIGDLQGIKQLIKTVQSHGSTRAAVVDTFDGRWRSEQGIALYSRERGDVDFMVIPVDLFEGNLHDLARQFRRGMIEFSVQYFKQDPRFTRSSKPISESQINRLVAKRVLDSIDVVLKVQPRAQYANFRIQLVIAPNNMVSVKTPRAEARASSERRFLTDEEREYVVQELSTVIHNLKDIEKLGKIKRNRNGEFDYPLSVPEQTYSLLSENSGNRRRVLVLNLVRDLDVVEKYIDNETIFGKLTQGANLSQDIARKLALAATEALYNIRNQLAASAPKTPRRSETRGKIQQLIEGVDNEFVLLFKNPKSEVTEKHWERVQNEFTKSQLLRLGIQLSPVWAEVIGKERVTIQERLDRITELVNEKNRPVQTQRNESPSLKIDVASVEVQKAEPIQSSPEQGSGIIVPLDALRSRSELRQEFIGFLEGHKETSLRVVIAAPEFENPFQVERELFKLFPELKEQIFFKYKTVYVEAGEKGYKAHVVYNRVVNELKKETSANPVALGEEKLFSTFTRRDARKLIIRSERLDDLFEAALLLSKVPDDVWFRLAGTEGVVDLARTSLDAIRDAIAGQLRLKVAA